MHVTQPFGSDLITSSKTSTNLLDFLDMHIPLHLLCNSHIISVVDVIVMMI
jgi:hypothetical protein